MGTAHRCNLNGLSSGTAILIAGGDANEGIFQIFWHVQLRSVGSSFGNLGGEGYKRAGVGRPREALRMGGCEKMVAIGLYPVDSIHV